MIDSVAYHVEGLIKSQTFTDCEKIACVDGLVKSSAKTGQLDGTRLSSVGNRSMII